MRAFLGCSIAIVLASQFGCQAYPKAPPGRDRENVLGAVEEIVKARYPMAATFPKSDSVLALEQVHWLGNSRARKQVHVWVRRNYTGQWDADVSVRLVAQVHEPLSGVSDPASPYVTISRPMGSVPEWQTLQHLSGEEQELYEAVLARLNG